MEKVCIIGAGSSGITAAKTLLEANIPFDCFEMGSEIGGLWKYDNDNGLGSAYETLHINTSKRLMAYSDFPLPEDYPYYPSHYQIIEYFNDYVDHFGIRDKITFNTTVEKVTPTSDHQWEVTLSNGKTLKYKAVIVANGHHWDPHLVTLEGEFNGKQMHSHYYRKPDEFKNKNVLVVGIGNSAVDIACELAHYAKKTILSTKEGAHIIPKYILGLPVDYYLSPLDPFVPMFIKRSFFRFLIWLTKGNQERYGVHRPKHKFLQEHPTVSEYLLAYVGHGTIKMKPNVEKLMGDKVRFVDGTEEPIEAIIYATGYNVTFPFLDPIHHHPKGNHLELYHRVIHPKYHNLFFIGLIQPVGAIMPVAELQSKWIAGLLNEKIRLPETSEMHEEIRRAELKRKHQFVERPRHTLDINHYDYVYELKTEMKKRRAA